MEHRSPKYLLGVSSLQKFTATYFIVLFLVPHYVHTCIRLKDLCIIHDTDPYRPTVLLGDIGKHIEYL